MRNALVLLYWADRLNAVVCTTRHDAIVAMDVLLGPRRQAVVVELPEPGRVIEAQVERDVNASVLSELWTDLRGMSRRRDSYCLEDLAFVLTGLAEAPAGESSFTGWRLALGERWVPDPAMLIRRVLNGQDPEREPPLPRKRLKRRPLCLLTAQ